MANGILSRGRYKKVSDDKLIKHVLSTITGLQSDKGLFVAAGGKSHYSKQCWLRDCLYALLCFESVGDEKQVQKTYTGLFNIFFEHEHKIDWAIIEPPAESWKYIHARYDPETLAEIDEPWGNKQNDAVGLFLFKAASRPDLSNDQLRVIQKLVFYLNAIKYWERPDNGMWEEHEEVHMASVGACVAGLKKAAEVVCVPELLIKKGQDALLLGLVDVVPDLSLLSLVYPLGIVGGDDAQRIVSLVDSLVRTRGVIRYVDDLYYNVNGEAEWPLGLAWLAVTAKRAGLLKQSKKYLSMAMTCLNEYGELPELYYSGKPVANENVPLVWAQSLLVVALKEVGT